MSFRFWVGMLMLCLTSVIGLGYWLWETTGTPWSIAVIPGIFLIGFLAVKIPASRAAISPELEFDKAIEGSDEIWHFGGLDLRLSPNTLAVERPFAPIELSVHEIEHVVHVSGKLWAQKIDGEMVELGAVEVTEASADEGASAVDEAVQRRRRGDAADRQAMEQALDEVRP